MLSGPLCLDLHIPMEVPLLSRERGESLSFWLSVYGKAQLEGKVPTPIPFVTGHQQTPPSARVLLLLRVKQKLREIGRKLLIKVSADPFKNCFHWGYDEESGSYFCWQTLLLTQPFCFSRDYSAQTCEINSFSFLNIVGLCFVQNEFSDEPTKLKNIFSGVQQPTFKRQVQWQ